MHAVTFTHMIEDSQPPFDLSLSMAVSLIACLHILCAVNDHNSLISIPVISDRAHLVKMAPMDLKEILVYLEYL